MGHIVNGVSKADRPFITHEGDERFITGIRNGTVIGFKYFAIDGKRTLSVTIRGKAEGKMKIMADEKKLGEITISTAEDWTDNSAKIEFQGVTKLTFRFTGKGRCDFLSFAFGE